MAEEKKKIRNRLTSVDVNELSIVDRGAIGVPFLLYKRDESGGEETMTLEELQGKLDEALAEKEALGKAPKELEEKIKTLEAKIKEQEAQLGKMKEELDKAKMPPTVVKKSDMTEDVFTADFQKAVEVFKESHEVMKVGKTLSQKNESAIQAAYDALGAMLTEEAEKRKKKAEGDVADGMSKSVEEYNSALPEKKKEMEKQLAEVATRLGIAVN